MKTKSNISALAEDLTPWFASSIRPSRDGFYRYRYKRKNGKTVTRFAYWTGDGWSKCARTIEDLRSQFSMSSRKKFEWQGLLKKPIAISRRVADEASSPKVDKQLKKQVQQQEEVITLLKKELETSKMHFAQLQEKNRLMEAILQKLGRKGVGIPRPPEEPSTNKDISSIYKNPIMRRSTLPYGAGPRSKTRKS